MPEAKTPAAAPAVETPAVDHDAAIMAEVQAAITGEPVEKPVEEPAAPAETPPGEPPAAETPPGDNPPAVDPNAPPVDPNAPPAVDPNAPPAKKPSDEFGELPADVPAKTRERFDTLKSKFDEVANEREAIKAERDEAKAYASQWVDMVEQTGATPQQYGQMMVVLSHLNSGDPARLKLALDAMQHEAQVLASHLGVEIGPLHDPLTEAHNADLKERVELEGLDRATALELAANRARAKAQEATQQRTQQQAAEQQLVETATAQIRQFADAQRAANPDLFNAKYKALTDDGTLNLIYQLPPARWPQAIAEAFAKRQVATAPAVDPRTHAPAPPSGIRQTANPGNGTPLATAPASAEEAVWQSLGMKPPA